MFKPGDKMNPYDPASLELGEDGPLQRLAAGTGPMNQKQMQDILSDPAKLNLLLELMKNDVPRPGETQEEKILREKREWAEADAKSAELKEQGNAAFKDGDYKRALVVYTACMTLSPHEPLYPLNRAAVGLRLKLYTTVIGDASEAIEREFRMAKAYFRRGQALHSLGEWSKAEADYAQALKLQPKDVLVLQQVNELKRLRALPSQEQTEWLATAKSSNVKMEAILSREELKGEVEHLLGRQLDPMEDRYLTPAD
ncbi:Serine/threonine protein phosphatase 5 [Mycena chlorophos]|uniref:Serine/threonine protein phosphatase 5 n=1 Tax=Mycena chlorophos TaxID=658473 RepID=A0A8H6SUK7_MYCCL|nr:Serine/threonine protein phosphatase 5 [Mycena chlorophos]